MGTPIYVPVLKGKEGEFAALEYLSADVGSQITPLIEIPEVPYDYSNDRPSKSLDDHIAAVAGRMGRCWTGRPIFVDFSWIGSEERMQDGHDPIQAMMQQCNQNGVNAVPVVSRATSVSGLLAAGAYSIKTGRGCCVRLKTEDFQDEIDLENEITNLFDKLNGVAIQSADLVVDLADLGNDTGRAVLVARSILSLIPRRDDWRALILSAASFPEDLSEVDASAVSLLPRREWHLWTLLQRRPSALPRGLIYSDYAIAHPIPRELDPRTMRMSASIRYTTQDDWLILKGRNVRQYGFEQYFDLCQTLIEREEYSGVNFSWGDKYIFDCANAMEGPGNATTWRKVGTNHHVTKVVRSLMQV